MKAGRMPRFLYNQMLKICKILPDKMSQLGSGLQKKGGVYAVSNPDDGCPS